MGMPPDRTNNNVPGESNIDPTKNVLDLVNAAVKRIDDLAELRETHSKEIAEIRDKHYKELDDKEASRLNSIRQVDQSNASSAAKAALDAIQTLANTTAVTASANAKQVTDLATSIAASLAATVEALSKRIAALELSSAEGIGKTRVVDPQISDLVAEVRSLATARSEKVGSDPAIAETLQTILKTQSATATEIESLRATRNVELGKTTQSSAIWGFVVGGIGLAISVVLLILRFTQAN